MYNGQEANRKRVHDFISFCQRWHRRLDAGEASDASEFDEFKDIVDSDSWSIELPDSTTTNIGCPVFYGDEISWIVKDET